MDKRRQPHTPEHNAKIATAQRGKKRPWSSGDLNPAKRPEVRAKISATMQGRAPHPSGPGHPNYREEVAARASVVAFCECPDHELLPYAFQRRSDGKLSNVRVRYLPGHHRKGKPAQPHFRKYLEETIGSGDKRNHRKGADHPQWKGGITPETRANRRSSRYEKWREAVYRRDQWRCMDCGKKCQAGDIVAHHILPWSKFKAWRYVISNGRTMDRACHRKLEARLKKARKWVGVVA